MSTRYVWNKCDINFPSPTYTSVSSISYISSTGSTLLRLNPIATNKYKPSISGTSVIFTYSEDSDHVSMEINKVYPCSQYPYVVFLNDQWKYVVVYSESGYWYRDDTVGTSNATYTLKCSASGTLSSSVPFKSGRIQVSSCTAGSVIEGISNSSASYFPKDGISGDYWYKYLGSDSIDPTAINYSDRPRGNEPITVSVVPRTGTYGGTISYLYQYSINGGTWTSIQTTTDTSIDFEIPATAKTIQFRVRAKDDMGFTSTDYVTGALATVERLNAWIGVSNKARKGVELYVGVNGKARKVTAAYIGVNGKARRFL